jgi:Flp pilus assembly pilin Flp
VTQFIRLLADESGVATVQYALISAVFAVLMIAALAAIVTECSERIGVTSTGLTGLGSSPP